MSLAVKSLASRYSKQYFDKLRKLLLHNSTTEDTPVTATKRQADFELDLEVVYDHDKKVEEIIFK